MSRGRASILISLATAIAVGGGWLVSQLTGEKAATRLEASAPALLLPAVYAACGTDETCVKNGIAETVNANPAGSVDTVLGLFETPQAPRGGCHWAMRLLGQTLKPRTRVGEKRGLDGLWHVCEYAVLLSEIREISKRSERLAVPCECLDYEPESL